MKIIVIPIKSDIFQKVSLVFFEQIGQQILFNFSNLLKQCGQSWDGESLVREKI